MVLEKLPGRHILLKVVVCVALSCSCFYAGKRWATRYEDMALYSSTSTGLSSVSQNHVLLLTEAEIKRQEEESDDNKDQGATTILSPPPPNAVVSPTGLLREDGSIVTKEFPMDDQDAIGEEGLYNPPPEEEGITDSAQVPSNIKLEVCPPSMKEYIPCLDNQEEIGKLTSTNKGEKWERHCPRDSLSCIIPAPPGYRYPIPWPKSRDEVWYRNVPHTKLVEDKGGQNWIAIKKDKFIFPGGGTQFAHGADQYLDQMAKMVPEIAFGVHTRVALDVGCGVASWAAYLMSRDVIPLSIAPKDVHENQIQFALERGVPAMVAVFATRRLLYPSHAFDIIHCSRCRVEWTRDEGVLLLEVDRMLRPGGFFAWAAQPVYKHEGNLPEEWKEMLNLTERLCWKLIAKEGYIAVWQKPSNNSCYENRPYGSHPPLCDSENDPDNVWYVPMQHCITGFLKGTISKLPDWPMRLHSVPERLETIRIDAKKARQEEFLADQQYWEERVHYYLRWLGLKINAVRNVMDMNAVYGGFAAAIVNSKMNWWVMNIVPVNGPNTLPVIYDRGLIGVAHDWCESFDTYPRTYDLLHAFDLFTLEKNRCNVTTIMVEMDRILRPGGSALIQDSVDILKEVEIVAKAAKWKTRLHDADARPYGKDKLLVCHKILWHA